MLIIAEANPCFSSTFMAKLLALPGINLFCAVTAYFSSTGGLNNVTLLLNRSPSRLVYAHLHRPSHSQAQCCGRLFLYKHPCQQIRWGECNCRIACACVQPGISQSNLVYSGTFLLKFETFLWLQIRKRAMIIYLIYEWAVLRSSQKDYWAWVINFSYSASQHPTQTLVTMQRPRWQNVSSFFFFSFWKCCYSCQVQVNEIAASCTANGCVSSFPNRQIWWRPLRKAWRWWPLDCRACQ